MRVLPGRHGRATGWCSCRGSGADRPSRRKIASSTSSERLRSGGVHAFELGPPSGVDDDGDFRERAKEAAKRTYSAVGRGDEGRHQLGPHGPRRRTSRRSSAWCRAIVDQILNEETSLLGLTTIRDYDEYTFTHSVNVCIFSVALGRRLGLDASCSCTTSGSPRCSTTSASRACRSTCSTRPSS